MKKIVKFNDGWNFTKVEGKTESVNLPHTFNLEDGNLGGEYYRGLVIYKKKENLTFGAGQSVYLQIKAANSLAKVYINDTFIEEHYGGYSNFNVNLTKYIKSGEQFEVRIDVTNEHIEEVYPLVADFTFFGGLYRGVNLIVTDELHFDLDDYGSRGIYFSQTNVTKDLANFKLDINVKNASSKIKKAVVQVEIFDSEKNLVFDGVKASNTINNNNFLITGSIETPHLWHSTSDPYLYTVVVTLKDEVGNTLDREEFKQGFRYFHFDPKEGFFLNGEHMKLNGVSRHQCFDGCGWAQSEKEQKTDIELIREVGANSIRLAHYQHDENFYSLCDEAGFIIWAEIPLITRSSKGDLNGENALTQMNELIKQAYNHTSIIMWGCQNEATIGGKVNNIEEITQKVNNLAKGLDPNRVTTQAHVGHHPDVDSMHEITDIMAYNKYFGWYYNEVEGFDPWIKKFHELNPERSLGISEYGVEGILDYQTADPKKKDYTEQYHSLYHEKVMPIFNSYKYIWGTYVWNMFDFASAIRDEGGVKGMNNKGLVTYDRKTKKDAFFYYKALWSKESVLHLTSKRFMERADELVDIKVYSNLEKVNLLVNGELVATKVPENYTVIFEEVKLKDGENKLRVEGQGLNDETIIIRRDDAKDYAYEGASEGGFVQNWFSDITLADEAGEIEVIEGKLSIEKTLGDIMSIPGGEEVLRKYFAPLIESPMFEMAQGFTLKALKDFDAETFNDILLFTINEDLKMIDVK